MVGQVMEVMGEVAETEEEAVESIRLTCLAAMTILPSQWGSGGVLLIAFFLVQLEKFGINPIQ